MASPHGRCGPWPRPWQHVLEPLSGYLNLGLFLNNKEIQNGDAFNFGPISEQNRTVKDLKLIIHYRISN